MGFVKNKQTNQPKSTEVNLTYLPWSKRLKDCFTDYLSWFLTDE